MPERFTPTNVIGEQPYKSLSEASRFHERLAHVHGRFGAIIGITAVHGLEPQQIAANVGLALNQQFIDAGLKPLPIILPFVSGHPIYGERTGGVLRAVYSPAQQGQIYLSDKLGEALIRTEFGTAGYQQHLVNVRDHVPEVDQAFGELLDMPFVIERLDGKKSQIIKPQGLNFLEINAGANTTLAKVNGKVQAYEAFPVTFDGLLHFINRNNDEFLYSRALLDDVMMVAMDLRSHVNGIILPDLHTLGQEDWFASEFPEAFITPPWKERLKPPAFEIDPEGKTITVHNHTGLVDTSRGYRSDKGVVYINVSGSDLGAQSAKMFVSSAQEQGYVVATTPWLRKKWIEEEDGKKSRDGMENVLAAEPNILFAKNSDGSRLCKAFFMRLGMGSYAYAQLAGVPVIYLGFESLENPEMKGNGNVMEANSLGIRYTGQPEIITDVQELAANYPGFNRTVYDGYGIPKGLQGLPMVGKIILLDQMNRLS